MATTVSRRLIFVKRTKNPHAPLPRKTRPQNDPLVGEKAKSFVMLAAVPRPRAPDAGWLKFVKPALLFSGIAACGGLLVMAGTGSTKSYGDTANAEVRTSAPPARRAAVPAPAARAGAYPAAQESVALALSQRAAPTDESFLASAYVRRKPKLADISGECTVTGGGGRDVADCLRRAAGP